MAGGGGPLDVFNAFGSAASGLGDLIGGAVSGSGGQGVTPSGSVLPQTAGGDVLTNPTVTSQIAQQAGAGDQSGATPDQQQQIQQAQQAQQPSFTPPPQQAPAQTTQGQTPEQLGWVKQQQTSAWPTPGMPQGGTPSGVAPTYTGLPQNVMSPQGTQAVIDTGAAGGDTSGAGDTGSTGGQQANQQGSQGQQKSPLQRAGNVLKGLAAQNARVSGVRGPGVETGSNAAGAAPSNVAPGGGGAFNPLEALASLLGLGGMGQGMQGIANQVGPASAASGYGAGPPPSPAASTAQQQAAPSPPTAYDPTTGQPIGQPTNAMGMPLRGIETSAGGQPIIMNEGIPGAAATGQPGAPFPGAAPGETAPTPQAGVYGIAQLPNEQMVRRSQLAGTDTRPTAGFSQTMREQRAPLRSEVERNPRLRAQLAAMATLEHASDPLGPIESVMNRTAAMNSAGHNVSLSQMVNSKFYGPFKTGQMQRLAARYEANPNSIPRQYNVAIDTALSGSNVLGGATDQGSGRDPNVGWRGGKVVRDRETYNDWGGGLGHEGNARWRRATQQRVQEEIRGGGMRIAQNAPLTRPPPSPLLDRLRERGQQPTPTPPGVIGPNQRFDPAWGQVGIIRG